MFSDEVSETTYAWCANGSTFESDCWSSRMRLVSPSCALLSWPYSNVIELIASARGSASSTRGTAQKGSAIIDEDHKICTFRPLSYW